MIVVFALLFSAANSGSGEESSCCEFYSYCNCCNVIISMYQEHKVAMDRLTKVNKFAVELVEFGDMYQTDRLEAVLEKDSGYILEFASRIGGLPFQEQYRVLRKEWDEFYTRYQSIEHLSKKNTFETTEEFTIKHGEYLDSLRVYLGEFLLSSQRITTEWLQILHERKNEKRKVIDSVLEGACFYVPGTRSNGPSVKMSEYDADISTMKLTMNLGVFGTQGAVVNIQPDDGKRLYSILDDIKVKVWIRVDVVSYDELLSSNGNVCDICTSYPFVVRIIGVEFFDSRDRVGIGNMLNQLDILGSWVWEKGGGNLGNN